MSRGTWWCPPSRAFPHRPWVDVDGHGWRDWRDWRDWRERGGAPAWGWCDAALVGGCQLRFARCDGLIVWVTWGWCDGGVASGRYRYAESLGEREREHVRRLPRSGGASPRGHGSPPRAIQRWDRRRPCLSTGACRTEDAVRGLGLCLQRILDVGRRSWTSNPRLSTSHLPPASTDNSRSNPSNSILYTSIP